MKGRIVIIAVLTILQVVCKAQELYVFSEPASTRSAKSVAFNVTASYPDSKYNTNFRNRYVPQVMVGINKNLTINTSAAFSNYYRLEMQQFDGAKIYAKYRFLSSDDLHKHFRMAAFAEGGFSRHYYVYDEMDLGGDNDGFQAGLIATQLVKKIAFSATAAYSKMIRKNDYLHHVVLNHPSQMMGYSLSAGYLLLPRKYADYKQLNLNLYLELLGSKSIGGNLSFTDIAPAIQMIVNSNTKINIGTRFQLQSNMRRVGYRTLQVGLERTIFNFWK